MRKLFLGVFIGVIGILFAAIAKEKVGEVAAFIIVIATLCDVFFCCAAQVGEDIGRYHGWRDAQKNNRRE